MRILVIDDTQINLTSAQQTLTGHELTLVNSHEAAYKLLQREPDYGKLYADPGYKSSGREEQKAQKELARPARFDAVLTDLLMPPNLMQIGDAEKKQLFGKQLMAQGMAIAFHAAVHGARYVAVFSMGLTHHCHPAVADLDPINLRRAGVITVNATKVGFFGDNSSPEERVPIENTECPSQCADKKAGRSSTCYVCGDTGKTLGKNWAWALKQVMGDDSPA